MEVTAHKATDGRIYVELRDSEDKSIWCASHPAGDGYYAAQEFKFVAIGANDPVRDGWDERETVPAGSIELACCEVWRDNTESDLRESLSSNARDLAPDFASVFEEDGTFTVEVEIERRDSCGYTVSTENFKVGRYTSGELFLCSAESGSAEDFVGTELDEIAEEVKQLVRGEIALWANPEELSATICFTDEKENTITELTL